jgi:hypothetical protein
VATQFRGKLMGTYLFERHATDGAGSEATASLGEDVASALRQIDWVDHFYVHPDDGEDVVRVDVMFDEEWPELRASYPGFVASVFHRLGVRVIPNPVQSLDGSRVTDPLGSEPPSGDDAESMDLFLFED